MFVAQLTLNELYRSKYIDIVKHYVIKSNLILSLI